MRKKKLRCTIRKWRKGSEKGNVERKKEKKEQEKRDGKESKK